MVAEKDKEVEKKPDDVVKRVEGKEEEVEEKKEEEKPKEKEEEKEEVEKVPKDVMEKRIGRMYARIMAEREAAQAKLDDERAIPKRNGDTTLMGRPLTEKEAKDLWRREDAQKRFMENEMKVLMRHPTALNDDGTYNMDDPFVQAYVDVGRQSPRLAEMANGPELAEAMVEKWLGVSYKKGVQDGVAGKNKIESAHTGTSTVAVTADKITKLSDVEKKIATRMNMTEQAYSEMKERIKKGDKSVS